MQQVELARALGFEPPEYVHHGLLLGDDGKKLSKRNSPVAAVADLREAGIPAVALRTYLEELGEPAHDVHLDLPRIRRLAIDAIASMPDEELAAAAGAPPELVPALRGARDLIEARELAQSILAPGDGQGLGGGAADARALRGAARERRRRPRARPRAEGRRRRPQVAPPRADRCRAGPGALGGDRRAPARRGAAEGRCGSIAPSSAGSWSCRRRPAPIGMYVCGPTVYARAHIGNARPYVVCVVGGALAAAARLRGDARPQHHRRERQDLRGRAGCERRARCRRGDGVVSRGHGPLRPRRGRPLAEGDGVDGRDRRVHRRPRRARVRVRGRRGRLLPRRAGRGLRQAVGPAAGPGRGAGAEPAQGGSARLRPLEGEQAR